jgi:hypothetical protein
MGSVGRPDVRYVGMDCAHMQGGRCRCFGGAVTYQDREAVWDHEHGRVTGRGMRLLSGNEERVPAAVELRR